MNAQVHPVDLEQEAPAPAQLPLGVRRSIVGVVALAAAYASTLLLWTFSMDAPPEANYFGQPGAVLGLFLTRGFGAMAWALPVECVLLAVRMFLDRPFRLGEGSWQNAAAIGVPLVMACALVILVRPSWVVYGVPAGGYVGELVAWLLSAFQRGAAFIAGACCVACLVARSSFHFRAAILDTRTTVAELQKPTTTTPAAPEQPAQLAPPPHPPITIKLPEKPRAGASVRRTTGFQLPPTALLEKGDLAVQNVDRARIQWAGETITRKLASLGVPGLTEEAQPGPVITTFGFRPDSAVKVSKVEGLANDLAMALEVPKVRVLAPIPGQSRIGFEVPSSDRQTVPLRPLLESEVWHRSDAALPLALGTDSAGAPMVVDLARMPHLLVAGATGAGKSVGLNAMLASLLYRRTPDELRLILIDAKRVEFSAYEGIPHMLLPIVTEARLAVAALAWAVDEMERRYELLQHAGARDFDSYHAKAKGERLPRLVIIVDEVADLFAAAKKSDVEALICRIAQKARAAGIHLVLATQRPDATVITGLIKANLPVRIAYKVPSRHDSATIIGESGADKLLGNGDMLLRQDGSSIRRVHGAYIGEDEVYALCDHLRAQGEPAYDEAPELLAADIENDRPALTSMPRDSYTRALPPPLPEPRRLPADTTEEDYARACDFVEACGECSISQIQRQFAWGYDRASRHVQRMQADGVVGANGVPMRGAGRPARRAS